MEVQQVALDGERVRPKRGTIADVGHSVETLATDAQPGDVNAIGRDELVVAREVDGRHRVLVAVTATATGSRDDAERTSQQRARFAHFPARQQFSNFAAGNVM